MNLTELLTLAINKGASDLHLSASLPPFIRIDGNLQRLEYPSLDHATLLNFFYSVMSEQQRCKFVSALELDFALEIPGLARFRVNLFNQSCGVAGVFRIIPERLTPLEELAMPKILQEIVQFPHGLVLITGPTGSGKSTTLAALIDYINKRQPYHIITIEDPIEFVHQSARSLIQQREVHRDTQDFNIALRSALREDPDIILIGELRDLETIRLALTAAETGHLVFATLHTTSAAKTINRIIDVFPAAEKNLVRSMLSESLQAVVCQTLLNKIGGGRVAALEIMLCNAAIRNLIRDDKIPQIYSTLQTSVALGMQTLDQHLRELIKMQFISTECAREVAQNKELFS